MSNEKLSHEFSSNQESLLVEDFVIAQKMIRMFIDGSGGYGDQSASLNIMKYLRQLGFSGAFEVIYPDTTENINAVNTLFELPQQATGNYFDANNNIRFIKLSTYITYLGNNSNIEPVTLSLTGYMGVFPCDIAARLEIDIQHIKNQAVCKNVAIFFRAKYFIYISNWNNNIYAHYIIDQQDNKTFFNSTGFLSEKPANLTQAKEFLAHNPKGQKLLSEKPALETFITGMVEQSFDVLPAYGWVLQKTFPFPELFKLDNLFGPSIQLMMPSKSAGNMLQIITGARYAKIHSKKEPQKPLIIAVFYSYEDEANKIQKLIHAGHWEELEIGGAAEARAAIKLLNLTEVFSIATLQDASTSQRLQELKPEDILLLSIGSLPKPVFDGLYTHTAANVWPQIREGQSSLNSLVLTGKPHFRCVGQVPGDIWEIGYTLVTDKTLEEQLKNLYASTKKVFCNGLTTWKENSVIHETIGNLFIAARESTSPLSNYFRTIKEAALKPENDRRYQALQKLISILPANDRQNYIDNKTHEKEHIKTSKIVQVTGAYSCSLEIDSLLLISIFLVTTIKNYFYEFLPWNKKHSLTDKEKRSIDATTNMLKNLEDDFIEKKQSRGYQYGINRDRYNCVEAYVKNCKDLIDVALEEKKQPRR